MTRPTDDELVKRLRAIDQYSVEDCFVQSALYEKSADRIEALTAENAALRDAATEAAKQLRIIAGMDLMGASSTAYNAAREIEAALSRKVAP